jgi:hypothetical protein
MLFYLILSVLVSLEVLKLYVKYRIFIYLNTTPNKAYLWLANLMLIHSFIKWIFACLKARDYYLIHKNKHVKQY